MMTCDSVKIAVRHFTCSLDTSARSILLRISTWGLTSRVSWNAGFLPEKGMSVILRKNPICLNSAVKRGQTLGFSASVKTKAHILCNNVHVMVMAPLTVLSLKPHFQKCALKRLIIHFTVLAHSHLSDHAIKIWVVILLILFRYARFFLLTLIV